MLSIPKTNQYTVHVGSRYAVNDKLKVKVTAVNKFLLNMIKPCLERQKRFEAKIVTTAKEDAHRIRNVTNDVAALGFEILEKKGLQFLKEFRKSSTSISFFRSVTKVTTCSIIAK